MSVEICAPATANGPACARPAAPRIGAGGGIAAIVVLCWRIDVLKLYYLSQQTLCGDLVAPWWLQFFSI
jgi:hypothetical protein